ncbi:MAG: hypothetical protein WC601_10235 [Desulfotomaculaceae bacterium]
MGRGGDQYEHIIVSPGICASTIDDVDVLEDDSQLTAVAFNIQG